VKAPHPVRGLARCGTDERRHSTKTTWEPIRTEPHTHGNPALRRERILAMRLEGETWPHIATALGMSQSRVRAIYAESAQPAPQPLRDDGDEAILANLRAFLLDCPTSSRRTYGSWPGRLASPATIESRLGSWTRAVELAREPLTSTFEAAS